jgi:hypothetical protein
MGTDCEECRDLLGNHAEAVSRNGDGGKATFQPFEKNIERHPTPLYET